MQRRRHHRHERQDDDRLSARVDLRGRRHPCGLIGTVAYRIGDREIASDAHDARGAGRPARSARDGRRRLRRVRDGGVVARARAAPRRRHPVRGRRVHEPHARPPRLPRRHGGATSRPSGGCSRCCRPSAPAVVNVDDPRGAALAEAVAHPVTYAIDRAGRRDARAAVVLARRPGFDVAHAARARCTSSRGSSAGRTSTTSSRPSATAAALGVPTRRDRAGPAALAGVPGPVRGRLVAARRHHRRRRLRAYRRCAAEPARDGAAARVAAG